MSTRVRIPGTVRAWRGSTVYPGLVRGTKEYRRRAGAVARWRAVSRLGLAEYRRRERERQAARRAAICCR